MAHVAGLWLLGSAALPSDAAGKGLLSPEGPDWFVGALMGAGTLVLTTVFLRRWIRRQRASQNAETTRERLDKLQERSQRDTLDAVMVEVQETTRLCAAQIENRVMKLERVIAEADERIGRLEALLGGGGSAFDRAQESDERAPVSVPPPPPPPERRYDSERALRERVEERTARDVRADRGRSTARESWADDRSAIDPVAQRVYEMAEDGLAPIEIARELGEGVGKIELILALRA